MRRGSTGGSDTRRVVFLDIDGVLAPIRRWDRYGDLDPACIQVLNEIVARSGADVVVSSTWRHGKTVAELQEILGAEGFTGFVLDKTPTGAPGADRGEEIAAWLTEHAVGGYVIIDDHARHGRAAQPSRSDAFRPVGYNQPTHRVQIAMLMRPRHCEDRHADQRFPGSTSGVELLTPPCPGSIASRPGGIAWNQESRRSMPRWAPSSPASSLARMDASTWKTVEQAFHDHAVLVFPGQNLTEERAGGIRESLRRYRALGPGPRAEGRGDQQPETGWLGHECGRASLQVVARQ